MNKILGGAAFQQLRPPEMSTVYAAVGLTTGAIASLIVPAFVEVGRGTAFVEGFFLSMGPMYLFATSNYAMTRALAQIKRLRDMSLITEQMYESLAGRIVDWYADRVCPLSARKTFPRKPGGGGGRTA
jgi:hypothetical protein